VEDIIKTIEALWNDPERMEARAKMMEELERKGKILRIDDVLLIKVDCNEERISGLYG